MSTKFLSPGWRMPRNANQSKFSNYSMDFDGSGYINIQSSTELDNIPSNPYSFSFWFKSSTAGSVLSEKRVHSNQGFVNAQYTIHLGSGYIQWYGGAGSSTLTQTSTTLIDNQWHHIVCVAESTTVSKIYVDGQLDVTSSVNRINSAVLTGTFNIGSNYGGSYKFNGQIDAFSIFDYALSKSQVTTLYGTGSAIGNPMALPSPPIAYYPLGTSAWNGQYLAENNAIGDYVFDNSSSNNRIIISNNSIPVSGDSSISFWFNAGSNSGYKHFITSQNYYTTGINNTFSFQINGTTVRFIFANGQTLATILSTTIDLNTWYSLTVTLNISTDVYKVYLNGTQVGSDTSLGGRNISDLNQGFSIFNGLVSGSTSYSSGFIGKLSNVQIFNTELSGPEVETLYNYGSPIRTLANIPQNSNLKAWYKLDASEVYNSTSTEWSIDNNQNPSPKSSLSFNSGSTRVVFNSNSLNITSALTVSGWFRIPTSNTGGGGTNIQFFLNEDATTSNFRNWSAAWRGTGFNYVWFAIFHNDGTSISVNSGNNFTPNDGEWHHYFGTWDGTTNTDSMKLYIDNELVGEETPSQTGIRATSTVGTTLGAVAEAYSWSFEGELSNWAVWNSSQLSELSNIYNQGAPATTYTNTPLGWWKLNNKTSGIEDLGSGGNNGVIGTSNTGVVSENAGFVSKTAGESSGMTQANLIQSDLQTVAPYSKYAMNFDAASSDYISCGNDSSFNTNALTVSCWVKCDPFTPGVGPAIVSKDVQSTGSVERSFGFLFVFSNMLFQLFDSAGNDNQVSVPQTSNPINTDGQWHHLVATVDGTTNANGIKVYIDNVVVGQATATATGIRTSTPPFVIGGSGSTGTSYNWDGQISNVSYWNAPLTSAQVTEIYNEGLPSNLNNHSAYSNLVSWWQLGENSSFASDWICADEKGTNNGESQNMGVDALVNGVGTTANGVSSGMSEGNLVGDAPYSTANAISSGMVITSRLKEVPPSFDTSSFLYDGIDEYFSGSSVYSALDGLSNYAVSCWFRSPSYSQTNEILHTSSTVGSIPNQVRVYTRSDRRVFIDHGSNGNYQTYSDNTTLVDNQWYHILCTRDASRGINDKMRIYINGINKTANDNTRYAGGLITANQPLFIASASNSTSNEMQGELDEIAIYNQDMASYVSEIYAGGKVVNLNNLATAPNPISYFRSEKATWDGSDWNMKDINSTYTVTSSNMEQADKTTNVP